MLLVWTAGLQLCPTPSAVSPVQTRPLRCAAAGRHETPTARYSFFWPAVGALPSSRICSSSTVFWIVADTCP